MLADNKSTIRKCSIPTPYPIGDLYAYLIMEDPLTLVDVGVATQEAREAWDYWLKKNRLRVQDIKRIILTHGHSDHYGLAREFAEKSGAYIYLHPSDWQKVINRERFYTRLLPLVEEHGIPKSFLSTFIKILKWENNFCLDIPEDMLKPLEDGDTVEFEKLKLKVVHVPGHSPGHIILMNQDQALSGDFIFMDFTPIPVVEATEKGERLKSAILYKNSLRKAKELGLKTYIPSHREEVGDFQEALKRMAERMAHKESLILNCIKEKKSCTAYEIISYLYPDHNPKDIYILASEILGRLDLMEEKGIVRCEKRSGVWYYSISS